MKEPVAYFGYLPNCIFDAVKSIEPITSAWVKLKVLYYACATGIKYKGRGTKRHHYVLNIDTAREVLPI